MNYKIKDIPEKERPRERALEYGIENISNIELLSIILKTGTKGINVKELSTSLLKKYDLKDFNELSINKLKGIKGIGEIKALELIASIELGKRINIKGNKTLKKLISPEAIYQNMKYLFFNKKQELFYALYFNNNQELIGKKLLFMGTVNQSITHPREIFKEAYRLSASKIVCMHNHPSNNLEPSKADVYFTNQLVKIGQIQGISVIDHIIVGDYNYYSFYDNNKMKKITNLLD